MRHRMLKRISVRGHDAGLHDIWKADDIFSNPKLNESVKVWLISFLKSIIYRSWNIIPSKYLRYFCAAQKSNSLGYPKQIEQLQSSRSFWSVQVITSRGDVSFTLTHHWEWYVKNSPTSSRLPTVAASGCLRLLPTLGLFLSICAYLRLFLPILFPNNFTRVLSKF